MPPPKRQFAEKFSRESIRVISQFRGLPDPTPRGYVRQPVEVASLVNILYEKYEIEKPNLEKTLMEHWREVVGERLAHRCVPQRIADGDTLIIAVGNATLRQEMLFQQRRILGRIRDLPGAERIKKLRILAG
jgi:hypothetical protein